MRIFIYSALALVLSCLSTEAQVTLTQFSTGFTAPVDIKNCGDDRLFIVEQNGRIQVVDTDGVRNPFPFLTITDRVRYGGEQGLLGLAFPPDFLTSGYFYVNYTAQPNGRTRISRFHVDPGVDSADRATEEILLTIYQPFSNHNGGHIMFGPDGYLYIGMGDGGSGGDPGNRSQNPDSLLGKMLRIGVDPSIPTYTIPESNVFASDTTQGRPEIYSIGWRNQWKWSFDRLTGDMWAGDVGQNVQEEINFEAAGTPSGRNYGWRCYEGTATYNTSGCGSASQYVSPVHTYTHASGGCSVTGGYVYRGGKFAELYGRYFFTDYCASSIRSLIRSGNSFPSTNHGTLAGASAIVSFGEDRWGELYCSGISSGIIYKMGSVDCTPVAAINGGVRDTVVDCGTGTALLNVPYLPSSSYTWSFNGNPVATDTATVLANQEGFYTVTVSNNNCTNTDSIYVDFITPLTLTVNNLDTLYCVNDNRVNLLPNLPGGVFAGPGISGVAFDPSIAGEGLHTITYTYTASNGCVYTFSQVVRVDLCTGIEKPAFGDLKLYPSPSQGKFSITGNFVAGKKATVIVMDEIGKKVWESDFMLNGEDILVEKQFSPGMYFVQVQSENSKAVLKLLVQ